MSYSCYKLSKLSKAKLLSIVKPRFDIINADHVTYQYPSNNLPPLCDTCTVYAELYDDDIQAVLVEIDGLQYRPDGKKYHITISHTNNVKPVYSNIMIQNEHTFIKIDDLKLQCNSIIQA